MTRKRNNKKLLYVLISLLLLVVTVISGRGIIPAFADTSSYTDVLTDLEKDEKFNVADYPDNSQDYSIQVIQIAESTGGELFIYTYQPCQKSRYLVATSVNMSLSDSADGTGVYKLTLLSTSGVFGKYKVNGLKISDGSTRFYNITSIYRPWDRDIDSKPENGNTINEVSFAVGKLFIAETKSGIVTYSERHLDTVTITEKYVGTIRYSNGFFLYGNNSCDSHYVAFSTDRQIDMLYEVDVYYVYHSRRVYTSTNPYVMPEVTEGQSDEDYAYLTCDQKAENPAHGWRGKKYTWKRIEKATDFAAYPQNDLKDNVKTEVLKMQWVLRFFESPYQSNITTTGTDTNSTVVESVSILRLKFVTDGVVYNLGVVDNKQTGSHIPDNNNTGELESIGFFAYVWRCVVRLFNGTATLTEQIVAVVAIFIVVLALPILLTVLSLVFPAFRAVMKTILNGIWTGIKWLGHGLWWLICLPFKGIAALVHKIRGE